MKDLTFSTLVTSIMELDRAAVFAVGRQAQQVLSLRNWLTGAWIGMFEQESRMAASPFLRADVHAPCRIRQSPAKSPAPTGKPRKKSSAR